MTLFYGQNSIKFSQKSSAILHFRDSKLKNFPYKASHLQRPTRASNFSYNLPLTTKRASNSYGRIRSILTVGVKMLCFFVVFYCQDSIKSSIKSSAILHFRNSKLKNFPYKASHLWRSTRASKLQFQPPPPNQKELPTALQTEKLTLLLHDIICRLCTTMHVLRKFKFLHSLLRSIFPSCCC